MSDREVQRSIDLVGIWRVDAQRAGEPLEQFFPMFNPLEVTPDPVFTAIVEPLVARLQKEGWTTRIVRCCPMPAVDWTKYVQNLIRANGL